MSLLPKRMALGDDFSLTLGSPIRPAPPAPVEQSKVAPSCMTNMLTSDVKGIIKASPTQPEPVEPVSRHNLPAGQYDCKIGAVGIYDDKVMAQLIIDESKLRVNNAKVVSVDVEPADFKMAQMDLDPSKVFVSNTVGQVPSFESDFQMRVYGGAREGGKSFLKEHYEQIAKLIDGQPRQEKQDTGNGADVQKLESAGLMEVEKSAYRVWTEFLQAKMKKEQEAWKDLSRDPMKYLGGANAVAKQPSSPSVEFNSDYRPAVMNRPWQAQSRAAGLNLNSTASRLDTAVEYLQLRFPAVPNLIRAVEQQCCMPPHVTEGLRTAHERGRLEADVRQYIYCGDFDALLPAWLQMGGK